MDSNERLKRIDEFFENLSIDEFEQRLEAAGIREIKPSSNSGMEFSLNLNHIINKNRNTLYPRKKYQLKNEENYYNFSSEEYVKAV